MTSEELLTHELQRLGRKKIAQLRRTMEAIIIRCAAERYRQGEINKRLLTLAGLQRRSFERARRRRS